MTKDLEWWRGAVIYQIYPRSFMDANNDGIGDLVGITDKLDYVADLGVDAIWISPFFKSPMKDFGYDVSDYRDIDPMFGDLNDFKVLLDKAHNVGLKIMIDQVWSHSSDEHEWFVDSRSSKDSDKSDWYIWADAKPDGTAPNNWLSYFGGPAWTWDTKRCQYYLHHFLREQPALNIWNHKVREELLDIARFWFDMGVDGFRLDAMQQYLADPRLQDNPPNLTGRQVADLPPENPLSKQLRLNSANFEGTVDWLKEVRAVADEYDAIALMAEVGGEDAPKVAANYVQAPDRFHLAYTFDLFSCEYNKQSLEALFKSTEEIINSGWICWSTSNHDVQRVASRWYSGKGSHEDYIYQASVLPLCMRGSYCMYQGEELGLPEADVPYDQMQDPYGIEFYPEFKGRDGCRTPMVWDDDKSHGGFSNSQSTWLPVSKQHLDLAISLQLNDSNSSLERIKRFLKWRRSNLLMLNGDVEFIQTDNPNIISFKRPDNQGSVVCYFNLGIELCKIDCDDLCIIEEISSGVTQENDVIHLNAYAVAILK